MSLPSHVPARDRAVLTRFRGSSAASWLFDTLVEGPGSRARFDRVKQLHAEIPWSRIQAALRVSKTTKMMRVLEDLLLGTGRSRSSSLLEKCVVLFAAGTGELRLTAPRGTGS